MKTINRVAVGVVVIGLKWSWLIVERSGATAVGCDVSIAPVSGHVLSCARSSRIYAYHERIDKVRVSRAELEALQERCPDFERRLRFGPDPTPSSASASRPQAQLDSRSSRPQLAAPPSTLGAPSFTSPAACPSVTVDVTPSEGRLLHDPDGTARYFGESSGANFTMQPLVTDYDGSQPGRTFLGSLESYQTYNSPPFQVHSLDPTWLPSRTSMTVFLTELRYFAQYGNGDFPGGDIFYWGDFPRPRHQCWLCCRLDVEA